MRSEISQTHEDKYCMISLIYGIYKSNSQKQREQNDGFQGLGDGGVEGQGDVGLRVQTFSYKMNSFWGPKVQHGDYS